MNGREYILAKQTAWAQNQNIQLIGSKIDRGRPAYTPEQAKNQDTHRLRDMGALTVYV